jgi:endonuclease YncB( thermonuclease family)
LTGRKETAIRSALFLIPLALIFGSAASAGGDYTAEAQFKFPPRSRAQSLGVTEVFDGESLALSDGRRIGLIGVAAPAPGPHAAASRAHLAALVAGRAISTEPDPAHAVTGYHDPHGRFLAYVFADGTLVNAEMIRAGLASGDERLPFRLREEFLGLSAEARAAGLGMWKDGGGG